MICKRFIRKRYSSIAVLTTLILISCAIIIRTLNRDVILPCEPVEAISCHHTVIDDDLDSFDRFLVSEKKKSSNKDIRRNIFFHETTCKGDLSPRQACSVEAAARAHPSWDVHVLFSAPVPRRRADMAGTGISSLQGFPNIKLWRLHIQEFVKETPLEDIVFSGKLNSSCYPTVHTADLLRLVTLYKHPGLYLDLDILVIEPSDPLGKNYLVRESDHAVSSAVLAFSEDSIGRSFVVEVLNELAVSFNGDGLDFGENGPALMLRVLRRRCHTERPVDMNNYTCQGLPVYAEEIAYPVIYTNKSFYFDPPVYLPEIPQSYHTRMHHTWNHLTHDWPIPPGSVYHRLAVKYCPQVYSNHTTAFGG